MIERRWLGAIAGMIGPALFVVTFTIEGWLRPGYRARDVRQRAITRPARPDSDRQLHRHGRAVAAVRARRGRSVSRWKGIASRSDTPHDYRNRISGLGSICDGSAVDACGPDVLAQQASLERVRSGRVRPVAGELFRVSAPVPRGTRRDGRCGGRRLRRESPPRGRCSSLAIAPTRPPEAPNAFNAWNGAVQRVFVITYLRLDLHVCVAAWLAPGRWSGRETGSPSLLSDIAVA